MPAKPESKAIARIHRRLSPTIHKQAMGLTSTNGTPDYYYESSSGRWWVEYKWSPTIKPLKLLDLKSKPALSGLQRLWLKRAYYNKQPVAVIVCFPEGLVVLENMSWEQELTVNFIKQQLCDYTEFAHCIETYFE